MNIDVIVRILCFNYYRYESRKDEVGMRYTFIYKEV
jgi:hypothetical protein